MNILQMVKSSADGLLVVINDILDFSKIEAGKLDLESIPFELRIALLDTLKTLAIRAHKKGIELTVDIPAAVPETHHRRSHTLAASSRKSRRAIPSSSPRRAKSKCAWK